MDTNSNGAPPTEAGFTLVEVLIAIVVLVFGLIAVTNLLLVGASNNTAANLGTASTAAAAQQMEVLKARSFAELVALTGPLGGTSTGTQQVPMQGAGAIQVNWTIERRASQLMFITVQAQGSGAMVAARSRAILTSFRSCTAETAGCPAPGAPPTPPPSPTP
ncbi:MAG: prepilin-type N-terminal cleavage/methylation domain-containing protein [Vicinamibacteria bacterium]